MGRGEATGTREGERKREREREKEIRSVGEKWGTDGSAAPQAQNKAREREPSQARERSFDTTKRGWRQTRTKHKVARERDKPEETKGESDKPEN